MNKMITELIELTDAAALQAFNSPDGLQGIINDTRQIVEDFEHDLSTKTGRKKTASFAYKVSQIISKLDTSRKGVLADWAQKTKAVNANWKDAKEQLRVIQEEVRRPLDDWEAEQAEIEARRKAQEEAEKLAIQLENDHEIGLLLNDKLDADRTAEAKRIKDERIAYEARIAEEAAVKAKEEAEQAAEDARIKTEQLVMERELEATREAEAARAKIERDKLKAQRAEVAAKEAKQRAIGRQRKAEQTAKETIAKAQADAEAAAEQATQDEIARQRRVEADAKAEQERREANKRNVGLIRRQTKESLMKFVDEATAKCIVLAIHSKKIANVTIHY